VLTQQLSRLVRLTFTLTFTLTTFAGTSASAQTRESGAPTLNAPVNITFAPPSLWPRSYVVAHGGLTFGTRTAPLLGVEVGGQVAPMLQAYGAFDWHRDISPSFVEDVSQLVSNLAGADVNYRFPAFTGVAGVKVIAPQGKLRPYGLGGFGYGRVNGKVELEGEDITGLLDQFGYLDRDDVRLNKVLFEVGAGIAVSRGSVYVDIGYRFRKFLQTGEPINMSGLYTGFGVGF
jgi:opacity protein-like surface antigen